mmetsp:Transcript_4797/g.15730  ORF Transcript_4797/g.15730 Transcript_4797/m.15730 type:complete len:315 (+) Transcript_4797:107-1051(+)
MRRVVVLCGVFFFCFPGLASGLGLKRRRIATLRGGAVGTPASSGQQTQVSHGAAFEATPAIRPFTVEEIVQPLDDLLDRNSRVAFVRKVYGLLSGSLSLSAASVLLCASHPGVIAQLAARHPNLFGAGVLLCGLVGVGSPMAVAFVPALGRGGNALAVYGAFSASMAAILGVTCSTFRFDTVVLAMVQTLAATLALTAYGFQPNPRYDLTGLGSVLFSFLCVSLFASVLRFAFGLPGSSVLRSTLGALLFSAYIVYDTQLIVGGKNKKRQMDTRDYVLGAMTLYADIANLFLILLELADGPSNSSSADRRPPSL